MTKSFKDYITEMPHLIVGSDVIDLELEVRSNQSPKEFLQFFKDLFKGKRIPSKIPSQSIQLASSNRKAFALELLNNEYLQMFTSNYYGSTITKQLNDLLYDYAQ